MIGTVVGNYRIVEKLGDGGMGAVYRAVDELLDREVAVKVLRSELAGEATLIERFRAEAIALARLNHPRIATLHGLERNGKTFVMIMEYVRGDTLEQVVARSGGLSWVRAAEICVDICDALEHAHDKGVVHRDIKPANVMLSTTGQIKVMDFGIARVVGRDRQTQFGHAVGTPMYMAPEQLRGEEVDGRADLYALGAVLFELITGRVAFEADSDYALMMKQLNEPPPPPSAFVREVPEAVDALVRKAMAKSRKDRPANAAAMRAALREVLHGGPRHFAQAAVSPTRVAAPPPPVSDGLPETRFAAVQRPIVETRLRSEVTPITAAVPQQVGTKAVAREGPLWRMTGRHWLAAALLLVAVGAGASRRWLDNGDKGTGGTVREPRQQGLASVADTSRVVVPPAGAGVEPSRRTPVQLPRVGSLQPVGGGQAVPKTPPPEAGPGRRTVQTPAEPRQPEPPPQVPREGPPTDVVVPPSKSSRAGEASTSESGFRVEVAKQVEFFVQAVRDRSVTTVERLLLASGTNRSVHEQFVALLQAGRVEISDIAITQRARTDGGGSAQFGATLNFRSPFGANRKTEAQFSLELKRDADDWKLASAQVVGSPKFR